MKNHKIGQERALGVVVADLSKKGILLRGLAPTSKSKVLSDLDPMWPPSAPNPGGGDGRGGEFQAIETVSFTTIFQMHVSGALYPVACIPRHVWDRSSRWVNPHLLQGSQKSAGQRRE